MAVVVNGRSLGVQSNGIFTAANTDPIPGGKLWPEAALTWNAMVRAAAKDGIVLRPAGPNSSARSRGAQDYFWTHQPPPAARPYTSNHGWAIAVDVSTRAAAAWLLKHAARYGWSWDEGRRVGEWWHFRYVGVSKARLRALKPKPKRTTPPRGILGPKQWFASKMLLYHRRTMAKEKQTGEGPRFHKQLGYARRWLSEKGGVVYYRNRAKGKQRAILNDVIQAKSGYMTY